MLKSALLIAAIGIASPGFGTPAPSPSGGGLPAQVHQAAALILPEAVRIGLGADTRA